MRLTLRTLLAWLDDTLLPGEVREIGKQVGESTFARDLVERIHRVTRQRRLTVPPSKGPDAIDANIVASYLDNELDPDIVAELEKKCLTSDVHLAEVASVHQILSLIGQKAKVPNDARSRMYGLVRGREAVGPRAHRETHPEEAVPVSEPVQPWVMPPPPRRVWYERYGPVAAVVALILVLCWSAYRSLETPRAREIVFVPRPNAAGALDGPPAQVKPAAEKAREAEAAALAEANAMAEAEAKAEASARELEKARAATKEETKTAKAEPAPISEVPPGAVGLAKKPVGVLLRFNSKNEWDRLTEATSLREQDRLLNLAPYRSTLELGSAEVEMVGETEIWVKANTPAQAARLSLVQGRVVLHGTAPSLPFLVTLGDKTITITPPPKGVVGIERLNRRAAGEPSAAGSVLRVHASEGPVTIGEGAKAVELDGNSAVTVEPDGKLTDQSATPTPNWVTERSLSPFDEQIGEQFLRFFPPGRPIVANLVGACEDESPDIARLAVSSLRAVGDIEFIVPLLNRKGDPNASIVRRAAISVLRAYLAQGADAAKLLREQLKRDLGDELAATAEKLLVGYTPKEANDPATYVSLVTILGMGDEPEVGLRELALNNLTNLTGRDSLDFDPEHPDGPGLKAWRELLKNKELKPAATKGAAK